MKRLALVLSLGAGLGILAAGGAAQADKLKDITCEQYLAMDEAQQDDIVYWIDGAATASSKKKVDAADIEVGYDASERRPAGIAGDRGRDRHGHPAVRTAARAPECDDAVGRAPAVDQQADCRQGD